jgi:hypothetical protein
VVGDEPERAAIQAERSRRHLASAAASEPRGYRSVLQLAGISVLARVELEDDWVEIGGEARPSLRCVCAGGDDYPVRLDAAVRALDHE